MQTRPAIRKTIPSPVTFFIRTYLAISPAVASLQDDDAGPNSRTSHTQKENYK
jgi:hypothetical protein